jgi:hypothetical protein
MVLFFWQWACAAVTGQLRRRDQQAQSKAAEVHLILKVLGGRSVERDRGQADEKPPRPHGKTEGGNSHQMMTFGSLDGAEPRISTIRTLF